MKGKVTGGKSFRGVVKYILDEGAKATGKKKPVVVSSNMGGHDAKTFTREFSAVSKLRGDIQKPVFHVSLALPKGESLDKDKWDQVVKSYLKKMGIDSDNHQYMAAIHNDTDNQHVHIVVNRVGLNKKIFLGKQSAKNTIKATMALETEFNLQLTHNPDELDKYGMPRKAAKKTPTDKELNMDNESARLKLQNILDGAIPTEGQTVSVKVFCQSLIKSGVTPIPNVTKAGKINGFAFSIDGIKFKGSQLGEDYNWKKVLSSKVLATEDDAQYLLNLKRNATKALDSQDDLTKDKFKKVGNQYKNQAQRAYWAVYRSDLNPDVAHKAIIKEFKSGDKQITIDGKHRLLDKGDVIMLRETDDMDSAIRAMIETGRAKGWGLNQSPSGSIEFQQRFNQILDQMKEEEKLQQQRNDQIRREEKAGQRQHPEATPNSNERDPSQRPANTGNQQDSQRVKENAGRNQEPVSRNKNEPSQHPASVPDNGRHGSLDGERKKIHASPARPTGSHLPNTGSTTQIDKEKRAVEAASAALSSLDDSGNDIADRIANDISKAGIRDTPNRRSPKDHHMKKLKAWQMQHGLLNSESYRIQLVGRNARKGRDWNMGGKQGPNGLERFWSAQEVADKIRQLSAKNLQDNDIYIVPIDSKYHYIVVDDLTQNTLNQMMAEGVAPTLIQESSANNLQAIIKVPKQANPNLPVYVEEEKSHMNKIVVELNKKYGDPNFSGVVHPFRLAGFNNKKPERNNEFTRVIGGTGETCNVTLHKLNGLITEAERVYKEKQESTIKASNDKDYTPITPEDTHYTAPQTAAEKDYARLQSKWRGLSEKNGWSLDDSRVDFSACKDLMMMNKYSEDQIHSAILSDDNVSRKSNPAQYATITIDKAKEALASPKQQSRHRPTTPKL